VTNGLLFVVNLSKNAVLDRKNFTIIILSALIDNGCFCSARGLVIKFNRKIKIWLHKRSTFAFIETTRTYFSGDNETFIDA